MQRHFPHILKQLISPPITHTKQSSNFLTRYFNNRANLKYCMKLWPESSKQWLINEGVNLRRQLQQAVQQQDKVQLLRVCSIPLYNTLKQKLSQKSALKLGSWGYHFQLTNIYTVKAQDPNTFNQQQQQQSINTTNNQLDILNLTKPNQWLRVHLQYKQQTPTKKLINRQLVIQRRIDEDALPSQNRWYIYEISI